MKRRQVFCTLALTVLVLQRAHAAPIDDLVDAVGNGNVNVLLTVTNDLSVDRRNDMVTTGVPLAREQAFDVAELMLTESDGTTPVVAQFRVSSRWGGTVDNTQKID